MGQYHYLVNLTKQEYINPHRIGNGLKLHEQIGWKYSTSTVLVMLLAASNGRGGGDFNRSNHPLIGSWAGDRIAFIGDYAEKDDIPGEDAAKIYEDCQQTGKDAKYKDISDEVRQMMEKEFDITYSGDGWMEITENKEST